MDGPNLAVLPQNQGCPIAVAAEDACELCKLGCMLLFSRCSAGVNMLLSAATSPMCPASPQSGLIWVCRQVTSG